jgi:hypothetical protein
VGFVYAAGWMALSAGTSARSRLMDAP